MERTETFEKDFRKFQCVVSDELPFSISPDNLKNHPPIHIELDWVGVGGSAEVLTREVFNQVQVKSQPPPTTL